MMLGFLTTSFPRKRESSVFCANATGSPLSRRRRQSCGICRPIGQSLYDLEVTLQLPIGDCIKPLPPFPLARRREVIDEVVAEPVAGELRVPENTRGLDQRARRAGDVFRALIGSMDGL